MTHYAGSSNKGDLRRKIIKIFILKEKENLFIVADDMFVYIENSKTANENENSSH